MKRLAMLSKILFVLVMIVVLPGCWNYKEVENFSVVAGVALDKNPNPKEGKYLMTLEIVDTSGGRDKSEMGSKLFSLSGDTMFDIDRNMISVTGSRVFWSHSKVLIISKEIAQEGLKKVIDWYNRDTEIRPDMYLLLSNGKTAHEMLENEGRGNSVVSFKLNRMLQGEEDLMTATPCEIWDFLAKMEDNKIMASMPVVVAHQEVSGVTTSRIFGQAVFRGDKLGGLLNGDEDEIAAMIKNQLKGGVFGLTNSSTGESFVLEIINSKTRLKPGFADGKPSISIFTHTEVNLDELNGDADFSHSSGELEIQKFAEKELQKRILAVVNKVQKQYKADMFGFGLQFYEQKPEIWKQLKDQWKDIYPTVDVNVTCQVDIESSAKTSRPVKVGN